MEAWNYSTEASIVENGRCNKGMLMLFRDEYAFGSIREPVNWEFVTCERGTERVKAFLHTVEKPCVFFTYQGKSGPHFVMDEPAAEALIQAVENYASSLREQRRAKEAEEAQKRQERENQEAQKAEEARIREEARRKTEEEYRQKQEAAKRRKEEEAARKKEALARKAAEKKERIRRELEACKKNPPEETPELKPIARKAGAAFLENPYRTLGISCLATTEEANTALDKLKKLARLKALGAYHSPFDLAGLPKPARDLSVAQNALVLLKDQNTKFFWFAEEGSCLAWQVGKYRIELSRDGEEFGTYDLFLANYLYAVLCDPDFQVAETWKRVLSFYCYICTQTDCRLLRSRFTPGELQNISNSQLLNRFRSNIFKPVLLLCERDDLDAMIRLHKYIKDCNNKRLDGLARDVLSRLVSWFTVKESDMMTYLRRFGDDEQLSAESGKEIFERGEAYCRVVEPVLEIVLRDFRGDPIRYDMIKESYRHSTYQLMYELNKCDDKSNAILYANKCFCYCTADDKQRIKNTFGEVNIKSIDWNTPHTGWDVKGDSFYFGRGCPVDYTKALYWYHKAADAGNIYSMNSIGLCYLNGHGVPKDDRQAVSWFRKAAKAGNPEGAYNLAECYYQGTGVNKSVDEALDYWTEAAKQGHPSAAKRRDSIYPQVQAERRNHRAHNHLCLDVGFQMTTGPNIGVEVTLSQNAYAYLVNAKGYQDYLNGNNFSHSGGYASSSPYTIRIPSSNHWYVIIDNGDGSVAGITASARVKNL